MKRLFNAVVVACALTVPAGAVLAAEPEPPPHLVMGPRVTITADEPSWIQDEFSADADPANPGRMVYCIRAFDASTDSVRGGAYVSFDNGKTWSHTLEAGRVPGFGYSDPACTYGLNGALYVAELSLDTGKPRPKSTWLTWPHEANYPQRMDFYRSLDGGRTWEPARRLGFIDHSTIVVDRTKGPYRGRVYIYGNPSEWFHSGQNIMWMLYSKDGGKTFVRSARTKVKQGWHHYGKGALLPDGTLLIPYLQRNLALPNGQPTGLAVTATSDGGAHLSPLRTVTASGQFCGLPYMAADNSNGPFRGRAYIIWTQYDRGPWNDLPASCVLMIASSDDRGKTWSEPAEISDFFRRDITSKGPDVESPAIAVNNRGVVAVNWDDTRSDPKNMSTEQRVSASFDGGQTWLPSAPLPGAYSLIAGMEGGQVEMETTGGGANGYGPPAPRTHIMHTTAFDAGHGGGDYTIFVTDPAGVFHALWSDNGGILGGAIPMYVAPITAEGTVWRNGSPQLEGLTDLTPDLELVYTKDPSTWTDDTYTLSLDYVLHNTSNKTLYGPLRMRFVAMTSLMGPEYIMEDNGRLDSVGSVIDVSALLPRGRLVPNGKSLTGHFRVIVRHYNHSIAQTWSIRPSIVSFDTRVFGRLAPR